MKVRFDVDIKTDERFVDSFGNGRNSIFYPFKSDYEKCGGIYDVIEFIDEEHMIGDCWGYKVKVPIGYNNEGYWLLEYKLCSVIPEYTIDFPEDLFTL